TRVLAQVFRDSAAIGTGIERCNHALAIRTFPHSNLEWDACRRTPCQLLGRKSFDSAMAEDRGQGIGKAEAVRKHELLACHAELLSEIVIAVQHVPDERLSGGNVGISFIDRGAARKPSTGLNIFL